MKILAIETSCDETAAAVVENGRKVLSSVISSQIDKHQVYGGVVPEIASRLHVETICLVIKKALTNANLTMNDLNALAVTHAPGLIGSLIVGVNFAKGIKLSTGLPLIPVHHLRSHIASNYITNQDFQPPFICLVVSGGHSHIIEVKSYTDIKIIGKTRDDAAGEAFDKVARAMGMAYPGGVMLDKIAQGGDHNYYKLPYPKLSGCIYDFSFSGLKTSVINIIHNANQKNQLVFVENLSASFRKVVVDCLVKNLIKVAKDLNYKKIAIAGGVSANSLLRSELKEKSKKLGFKIYMPDVSLCGDNAAMVGSQAYYEYISGFSAKLNLNACSNMSIEA